MKKKLLVSLLLLLSFKGISQKYELGKVTIDELKEKVHPIDTSAVAAILFKKARTFFTQTYVNGGFYLVTEVECRIKIYKKEGYEWANNNVFYFIGNSVKESVEYSSAVTYNLVDNKIQKSELTRKGEFDERMSKSLGNKKIILPNVKEGSVIEFKCKIQSPFVLTFPEFNFQYTIPVNYVEYNTDIPEFFVYNTYKKGFVEPLVSKSVASGFYSLNTTVKHRADVLPGYSDSNYKYKTTEQKGFLINQSTYKMENVPAIKEEAFVNNLNNYRISLQHELSVLKPQDSPMKFISLTWEDVVKTIYESEDFGEQINKTNYFETAIKQIVNGLNNKDEQILAIFNYVKSNIKWNGIYGIYCDKGVKKGFEDRTGNVSEINLMLTAMLNYAGVEASPVVLSTRNNGMVLYPSATALDYVIAAVEIENGFILLDATDENAMPNILPERALNLTGRIIRKNGSSAEVDLTPNMLSKKIVNIMANVAPDGIISGKVREQHYDYYAHEFRSKYAGLNEESYLEKLEKKYPGIEIELYKVSNKTDLSKQIVEDYSFKHSGLTEMIAEKIYINPMLFFTENENPFKQEKREYPVDFIFPNQDKYTISLTLPDGYVVESVPAPLSLSMEEGLGNFHFNIVNSGSQIQLIATLSFNSSIVPANYYEMLKNFYKNVVEKNKEKIVLKKV